MPHSTSDLPSQVAYAASLKAMTSNSSKLNGGGASSTSLDNKWKRASLPAADIYGEYKSPIESLRGRSGSMVSTASTAVIHRKSQYYENNYTHMRDKVVRDAPLIAELRTNVIIKDEYTLVTDLSYHLANRYSKPDSSIMINIDHSSCLALAGTFDPCYILTITTIPHHLSSVQNKRNASLIQTFMADILSVPPDRGVVRFVSIPEDNYAINGNTVAGELEKVEKNAGVEGVKRVLTDSRKSGPSSKRSVTELERQKANATAVEDRDTRAERRKSTVPPADITSPAEVFELAAETERSPTPQAQPFVAENGLRMNGISKEDLSGKTPNGRPKTFAGPATSSSPPVEALPAAKAKHISAIAKTDLQKAAHMPKAPRSDTKPARQQSNGSRANGTPVTPVTLKETIVDNPKVLKSPEQEAPNTSKRRSTMTAVPKVIPAPPPVPESKTPKVSKRKSFLAAFRR